MVIRIKLTVGFAAGFAYCLVPAGFITSDVVCNHLSAEVADVVFVRVLVVGDCLSAVIADVVFVCIFVVGDRLSAVIANMIIICVLMVGDYISANVAYVVFVCIGTLADYIIADITFVVFILLYWEKAAYEEAEHAAKFAELLGEVGTYSTKKNLEMRVDAENGATAYCFYHVFHRNYATETTVFIHNNRDVFALFQHLLDRKSVV